MSTNRVVIGTVTGPFSEEPIVCQYQQRATSKFRSIWHGNDPLDDDSTLLLAQIAFIVLVTRTIYALLKPLRQGMVTPQIMAGIVIGPTILGRYMGPKMQKLFPMENMVALQTAANMGLMFHIFVLGLKTDTSILKKARRREVLIALSSVFMPLTLAGVTFLIINQLMILDFTLKSTLPLIVIADSLTSFVVITNLLDDLNILNSELGRLATSTSMVSDMCTWLVSVARVIWTATTSESKWLALWYPFGVSIFIITIVFVFRPFIIWLTKDNLGGQQQHQQHMKESHVFVIVLLLLSCSVWSEIIGHHIAFGSFLLGIAIPDGPPLGATLVRKFDTMATGLLLPIFLANGGMQIDLFSAVAQGNSSLVVTELIIIMGYVGKFSGTLLPALYYKVPFWEAVTLALIMCSKGIMDLAIYIYWKDMKILDDRSFSLMLMTMLIVTGVSRAMIRCLYDPSKSYRTHDRRTIMHSEDNIQLKIMVCVYHEDNVPAILNLLEASNFSFFTHVSIFVLHLMELTGRAAAILVPYHFSSEHIVSAFSNFEQKHKGNALMTHFTAVAPYVSMHDDICSLAEENRTTFVIVPYHKQWAIDGTIGLTNPSIRTINHNVIKKAPCSVGILIDRGLSSGYRFVLTPQLPYRIGLLFFGGADDLEALAYSRRMAKHPYVYLTIIRFIHENDIQENDQTNNLDNEFIYHYKEKIVKDGIETARAIHSMEDDFDLVIVGRYHDPNSPLTFGLSTDTVWRECPELGVIGDMLASSDFQFSLLVVQQQPVSPHSSL